MASLSNLLSFSQNFIPIYNNYIKIEWWVTAVRFLRKLCDIEEELRHYLGVYTTMENFKRIFELAVLPKIYYKFKISFRALKASRWDKATIKPYSIYFCSVWELRRFVEELFYLLIVNLFFFYSVQCLAVSMEAILDECVMLIKIFQLR